jgi:HlyD family secretion protein
MLVVAAALALGIGYVVPETLSQRSNGAAKAQSPEAQSQKDETQKAETARDESFDVAQSKTAPRAQWAASAPGRVEPLGGEIRISAQVPGRITDVLVGVNDQVAAGDLLLRFADEELVARVHAARAEAAARKRDRDNEGVGKAAQDRRRAEDDFARGERWLADAREELDRTLKLRRSGTASDADADKARAEVTKAREYLEKTRSSLRKAMAGNGPAPTRLEAALAVARAELSLAEATLERARIRAPSNGTVLRVHARVGETAAPSPENALVVLGDVTRLRVRAEFEERDIGKVQMDQAAVVRSDAFPGRDFEGTVSSLARALGPSRLGQRGPRRPTDIDVLEVMIDLSGQPPLLPGMRVDVFLKAALPEPPAAALSGGPGREGVLRAS